MTRTDLEKPVFKPEINFKPETAMFEEQVTIVHCTYVFPPALIPSGIRIWPTTYLLQEDGSRKKLLQAFNIPAYPQWKLVYSGHRFTLIFEGLDKSCNIFALVEDIPEPGGFLFEDIVRNQTDVYWLTIQ